MNQFYLPEDSDLINESLSVEELLDQLEKTIPREFSFFDEILVGYISVMRQRSEEITTTRLDVQIINNGPETDDPEENGHVITLHQLELRPLKTGNDMVIYKFSTFINYPKMKLHNPLLKFTLFSNFKKQNIMKDGAGSSSSIEQENCNKASSLYIMEKRNLLSGYQSVRSNEIKPVLYDSSIIFFDNGDLIEVEDEEMGGEEQKEEAEGKVSKSVIQLNNTSKVSLCTVKDRSTQISHELPLIRILNIKIKNFKISKTSIISTIDIELTPMFQEFLASSVIIGQLNYKYENNLITDSPCSFPITLRQRDSYKFSYKLNTTTPYLHLLDSKSSIPLNHNKSLIEVQYAFNKHKLKTSFITNLDMNSFYQQQHGSGNLSSRSLSSSSVNVSGTPNTLASSISIRFEGINIVKLGDVFKMKVIVQNLTKRPRELVLTFNNNNSGSSSSYIGYSDLFQPNLPKIQTPIQSIASVSKTYHNVIKNKPVCALSLVNELRFQLNSLNDIYENEIKLIALERSYVSGGTNGYRVNGISVTDVNSGEAMSCDKLLEVVIE